MKENKQKTGFLYAIANMFTYGLLPVFSHYFVASITPLLFAAAVTLLGSLPLILNLAVNKQAKNLYSREYFKPLFTIGVLATVGSLLLFLGTKLTSGINTGLLIQLEPFFAVIIALLVFKEAIKKQQLLATIVMVLGAVTIVYKGLDKINLGDIFIAFAPLFFQLSHIPAKKIINKLENVYTLPAARLFYSGIILFILAVIFEPGSLKELLVVNNIIIITIFALIFRALDLVLWYQAIKRISVAKASAVIPLAAAISFLGSLVILKESVTVNQLAGLLLITAGLIWLSYLHLKHKI